MADDETNGWFTRPMGGIIGLVALHAAIGLGGAFLLSVSGFIGRPHVLSWGFAGVLFSQAALLGIWGGLAMSAWYFRLLGVVGGLGYLCVAFLISTTWEPSVHSRGYLFVGRGGMFVDPGDLFVGLGDQFVVAIFVSAVASPTWIFRCFRFRLALSPHEKPRARFQFSIRDLMILTVAVAGLTAVGKWSLSDGLLRPVMLAPFIVLGLMFWPLCARAPLGPSLTLVITAVGIGGAMKWLAYFSYLHDWCLVVITTAEAMALVLSGFVIRASGYRMIRQPTQ